MGVNNCLFCITNLIHKQLIAYHNVESPIMSYLFVSKKSILVFFSFYNILKKCFQTKMFIDYLPVHKQEQSLARLLGSKPMVLEVDRRCVLIVRFPLQGILVLLWR